MDVRRYTTSQLFALRDSPLVVKPDNLPAIEQWIEYVYLDRPDGGREKLRIPHSESAQHSVNTGATRDAANVQRGTRQPRPGVSAAGTDGSPMGSFSTGRPTLTTRASTLRGTGGQ